MHQVWTALSKELLRYHQPKCKLEVMFSQSVKFEKLHKNACSLLKFILIDSSVTVSLSKKDIAYCLRFQELLFMKIFYFNLPIII